MELTRHQVTINTMNAMQAPQVPNISERMRQEASELEQVRRDARENEDLMQKEVSEAKADAYRAHAEAARSRAQAEFEHHRCVQLEEQITEREQHLSTVVKQSTRQQVMAFAFHLLFSIAIYMTGREDSIC